MRASSTGRLFGLDTGVMMTSRWFSLVAAGVGVVDGVTGKTGFATCVIVGGASWNCTIVTVNIARTNSSAPTARLMRVIGACRVSV